MGPGRTLNARGFMAEASITPTAQGVMMSDLPQETIERLSRVTKLLKTQRTLPAKLEAVVAMVKRTIPNCDATGITLRIEGEPTSVAVSDRLAIEIDLVQYRTGEGPCLAAMAVGKVVRLSLIHI